MHSLMPWCCRTSTNHTRLCSSSAAAAAACLPIEIARDSHEIGAPGIWRFRAGTKAWHWRHSNRINSNTIPGSPINSICSFSITSELRASSDAGAGANEAAGVDCSRKPGVCLDKASGYGTLSGAVVALGKFDALHVGHRALAEQAARMGTPYLVSFTGMAEVLGWDKKLPLVANFDRKRVMAIWSTSCGGMVPQEHSLEFGKVRSLSPKQFVEKLALEFHVKGIVAGANYRFGYKAAGDASDLVHLCVDYGLEVFIVDSVMDVLGENTVIEGASLDNQRERGQVSSTRVRKALAAGDMGRVAGLLGRCHRLLVTCHNVKGKRHAISIPLSNVLNQPPKEGTYQCEIVIEGQNSKIPHRADMIKLGTDVVITAKDLEIPIKSEYLNSLTSSTIVGIEFLSENR